MISISVVSHAQNAFTSRMLGSLAEYEADRAIEVIITENTPDETELAHVLPGFSIKILRNKRPRGFASNHNAAFREAGGEFFCIVNPDVVWIQPIFNRLMQMIENGIGEIVAPLVVDSQGVIQDSFRNLPSPLELFQRRFLAGKGRPVPFAAGEAVHPDWIAGTLMFMPSATFQQLGGFDDRYYLYFEDVDLCSRARLTGHKITVDTGIRVLHEAHRRSARLNRYFFWHLASAIRFFSSPVYREIHRLTSSD